MEWMAECGGTMQEDIKLHLYGYKNCQMEQPVKMMLNYTIFAEK